MRKIMAVGSSGSHAAGSPQAKLGSVVAVIAGAGFVAGFLGIGGALIFNPFLLQLGVHPQARGSCTCSAATRLCRFHEVLHALGRRH